MMISNPSSVLSNNSDPQNDIQKSDDDSSMNIDLIKNNILNGVNTTNTNHVNNLKRANEYINKNKYNENQIEIVYNSDDNDDNEDEIIKKKKKMSEIINNNINNKIINKNLRNRLKYLKLKQLELNLRNEEAKLILLKRMYYSQRMYSSTSTTTNQGQLQKNQLSQKNPQQSLNQKQQQNHVQQQAVTKQNNLNPKPANGNISNRPGQNQLVNTSTPQSSLLLAKQHQNRLNNNNSPLSNTSQNKAQSPSSAFSPVPIVTQNNVDQTISSPVVNKKQNAQTQAIVNQLVRKEFEKSLSQLEFPPRISGNQQQQQQQMQQDIYFLPNANSPEFLMCLGLEEVVKCVQEHLTNKQQQKELKEKFKENTNNSDSQEPNQVVILNQIDIKYEYPFFCAQCNTDFSPVWRHDKNNVVLCEKCLKSIERKQIKQEHSAKLKQLFIKASKDKELFEKQVLAEQQQVQKTSQQCQQQQSIAKIASNSQVNNINFQRNSSPANVNQKTFQQSNQNTNRPSPNMNLQQHQKSHQQQQQHQKPAQNMSMGRSIQSNHQNSMPHPNLTQNSNHRSTSQNIKLTQQIKNEVNNTTPQQQRQRTSTGSSLLNHHSASSPSLVNQSTTTTNNNNNNIKSAASNTNLANANSSLAALNFPFGNLPTATAIAALAQQQQHQQQAAFLQRFIQQNQHQNINLLAGLQTPAAAALAANYLNMNLFSSPSNQTGNKWKNS